MGSDNGPKGASGTMSNVVISLVFVTIIMGLGLAGVVYSVPFFAEQARLLDQPRVVEKCLLGYFLWIWVARIVVISAQALHHPRGVNNRHPRTQQAQLKGWGARALAAHQNTIEGFVFLSVPVILALVQGSIEPLRLQALCLQALFARSLYVPLYLANIDAVRSLVWAFGFFANVVVFWEVTFGQ